MCNDTPKDGTLERMEELHNEVKHLHGLKASKQKSYEWGNSSKGYCRVAHSPILCRTLNNAHFSKLGYVSFYRTYIDLTETQPSLF